MTPALFDFLTLAVVAAAPAAIAQDSGDAPTEEQLPPSLVPS